jgi:hypothetical protein
MRSKLYAKAIFEATTLFAVAHHIAEHHLARVPRPNDQREAFRQAIVGGAFEDQQIGWTSEKMIKRDSGVVVRLIVFMQITGGKC